MELGGDEKRIQALFSELALEHQSDAPRFESLWTRTASTRPPLNRRFIRPVAVITAALIVALVSAVVVWSWYQSSQSYDAVNIEPQTNPTPATPGARQADTPAIAFAPARPRPTRRKKPGRQQQFGRALAREAAVLSSWRSPTGSFMQSPAGRVLSSLPQLNQSVQDLKGFLPKNNEVMKESNQ